MITENIFRLTEKYNMYMGIQEQDKKRFESIIHWSGLMMELSIKERNVRDHVTPTRGEIWTMDFGQNVGSETTGCRPCIILQEDLANSKAPTTIGAPITNHAPRFPSHKAISERDYEFVAKDGDAATGTIMLEQIRSLSKARLGRKIGKLSEDGMKKIDAGILGALGVQS